MSKCLIISDPCEIYNKKTVLSKNGMFDRAEICRMIFFKPNTKKVVQRSEGQAEPSTMMFSARRNKDEYLKELAETTKNYIGTGNEFMARQCLELAEIIYRYGDEQTRNLVSNIYVFAVSGFLEINQLNANDIFPELLRIEYKRQVDPSGL